MIILAIAATVCAAVWSFFVMLANVNDSYVAAGFQGSWTILAAWIVVAVFWLAWWFK